MISQSKFSFYFRLWVILLLAIVQYRCANESVPQGGKKDTKPAYAKKISPPNKTLHFNSDKVEITFNEYIRAGGFAQTLISPPMDKKPTFSIRGKTLVIKFKSPLRDSTTYTINFADDIKDANEGNITQNFTYVFSTGNYIDSQKIKGTVILAKDNSVQDGIVVGLYPSDSINANTRSKPFYFAKTDKSGAFQITNVKAGRYWIYGLKDQNYNYIYDQPNELVAFSDFIVELKDTLIPKVELNLFEPANRKLALDNVNSIGPGLMQISYTNHINKFDLKSSLRSDKDIYSFNKTNDTVNYWYANYSIEKAKLYMLANDTLQDSTTIALQSLLIDSVHKSERYFVSIANQYTTTKKDSTFIRSTNIQELYKPVKINFSRPIISINDSKEVQLRDDTLKKTVPLKFELDKKTKQFITADFEKADNTPYTVIIPDSTFQDIFSTWNKRTTYRFVTNEGESYGTINLTLKTTTPDKYYVIKLINANNEVVQEFPFSGNEEKKIALEHLLAGPYKFSVVDDRNRNNHWDTGDFSKHLQPEKIFTIKDTYQLKGGWTLDVEVKF